MNLYKYDEFSIEESLLQYEKEIDFLENQLLEEEDKTKKVGIIRRTINTIKKYIDELRNKKKLAKQAGHADKVKELDTKLAKAEDKKNHWDDIFKTALASPLKSDNPYHKMF